MAKTRRKRQTKHRGNVVGEVERRGRTSRKNNSNEVKKTENRGNARPHRLDQPPTWRGSLSRSGFAAVIFFGAMLLFLKRPLPVAITWTAAIWLLYIPMTYYTDLFIYRRRQLRKKTNQQKKSQGKDGS